MNRSTIVACGLACVIARQAQRIRRLNVDLRLVRAVHHDEMESSDEQIERLTAENKVIREENVKLLDKRFEESPS